MNKNGSSILIIDDEGGIRSALSSILEDEGYSVFCAEDAKAGMALLRKESCELLFLDVMLPKIGGIEALELIKKEWPELEVVMISGHASIDVAVRAVKLGAFDFLEKPLTLDKVLTVARNVFAIVKLRRENSALKNTVQEEILGTSAKIEGVRALIRQAAASEARILITGENGSGKELIARSVHKNSKRAAGPFVEVNCAAIPDSLLESELFGHEKGAFTDAYSARKGRFELACGGTLFLDEIGDMSLSAQAKVLRAIQEQKIERVGSEKTINVDVRILAATNKNLEEECAAGRFRQDLFFRINVIQINMPPLRERPEDILFLVQHFLKEAEAQTSSLSREAQALLSAYPWPGNVRELKNVVQRIAILCDEEELSAATLKNFFTQGQEGADTTAAVTLGTDDEGGGVVANAAAETALLSSEIFEQEYTRAREVFEKAFFLHNYKKHEGNIHRMSQAVGVYPSNLYAKLRKYNLLHTGKE